MAECEGLALVTLARIEKCSRLLRDASKGCDHQSAEVDVKHAIIWGKSLGGTLHYTLCEHVH